MASFLSKLFGKTVDKVKAKKIIAKFHVDADIDRASAMALQKAMEKALKSKHNVQAVALVVNSRGGSPVYSDLMARKVLSYAAKKNVPLYTFAESIAASGGYWLLAIGQPGKVYANESSIVGSVGVISPAAAGKRLIDYYKLHQTQIATSENLAQYKLDPYRRDNVD